MLALGYACWKNTNLTVELSVTDGPPLPGQPDLAGETGEPGPEYLGALAVHEVHATLDAAAWLVLLEHGDGAGDRVTYVHRRHVLEAHLRDEETQEPPMCVSMLPVNNPGMVGRPYQLSRANSASWW